MAKVEKKEKKIDNLPKKEDAKKSVPSSASSGVSEISKFFANLFSVDRYKPLQGFTARTATAVALGLILLGGLWQLHETLTVVSTPAWVSQPLSRIGIPAIFAGLFGWIIFRLVNYPIFAEFLIATEAEMNKVSWTTWNDLKRATTVVLVVVVLMTTYLWVVDQVWSTLLTWIGVLRIS